MTAKKKLNAYGEKYEDEGMKRDIQDIITCIHGLSDSERTIQKEKRLPEYYVTNVEMTITGGEKIDIGQVLPPH